MIDHDFLDESRALLADTYLPKIRRAVASLPEGDLWWRPNDASNSVGNLILHLAGNLRQWVVSGVGGAPDVRRRQEEFDERAHLPADALTARLREALSEVDAVLAALDPATLQERRRFQGHAAELGGPAGKGGGGHPQAGGNGDAQ